MINARSLMAGCPVAGVTSLTRIIGAPRMRAHTSEQQSNPRTVQSDDKPGSKTKWKKSKGKVPKQQILQLLANKLLMSVT